MSYITLFCAFSAALPLAASAQRPVPQAPVIASFVADSHFGLSGALRALFLLPVSAASVPALALGAKASTGPINRTGVHTFAAAGGGEPFHVVTLRPFADKVAGRIGAYRIGNWSAERQRKPTAEYAAPKGFIEVTRENQETLVSSHFRLRDFLTKDQHDVWPKYLVLSELLLDKLELLQQALVAAGKGDFAMTVMSGFRTPQYNARGVRAGGRASESRHQYGDAADVYLRGDRDWMPDLNGDGKANTEDAIWLARLVEEIERKHPSLAGGVGVYPATSQHGPFVHVDVRGSTVRWGPR